MFKFWSTKALVPTLGPILFLFYVLTLGGLLISTCNKAHTEQFLLNGATSLHQIMLPKFNQKQVNKTKPTVPNSTQSTNLLFHFVLQSTSIVFSLSVAYR